MATLTERQKKKAAAIVKTHKGKGGKTLKEYKFPIPDKAHAANAMARLNQAKGLTKEDKKKIARKARKFLGLTPAIAKVLGLKPKKKG